MKDCARYESLLGQLMSGERPESDRDSILTELRGHASGCPDCAGTLDLLDLLSLPADQRDLVDDPGEAYWETFNERVAARLEGPPAAAPAPASSGWRVYAALAAAVGVLGIALWLGLGDEPDVSPPAASGSPDPARLEPGPEEGGRIARDPTVDEPGDGGEDWGALADAGAADAADSGRQPWDVALFPEVETLSDGERRELLSWLRSQSS